MKLLLSLQEKPENSVIRPSHRLWSRRKRFFCLFVATFLLFGGAPARGQQLSGQTRVSLITVGPGTELYSGFGHSVLWFSDPALQLDKAYNYGTFSSYTDNFYLKFLQGTLPYSLSVSELSRQVSDWQYENRSITEQVLNLSVAQKQRLYSLLEENSLPQNSEYRYRFFYDNCATRLQDMLLKACGDSLKYDGFTGEALTFRQWIDKYAYKQNPWADFGMDLAIGTPADEIATPFQATFLPDNLQAAFAAARIRVNGVEMPLVATSNVLYEPVPKTLERGPSPTVFFWGLAVLTGLLTFWQWRQKKISYLFDRVLFTVCGFAGIILLLLWGGTDHGVTSGNWDILWACPLLIPMAFSLSARKKRPWLQLALIGYAALLLASTINLEKHNLVLVPILLTLLIRVYYINNSMTQIPTS